MKKTDHLLAVTWLLTFFAVAVLAHQDEPWRADQLLEPKDMAALINDPAKTQPLTIDVGPAGVIRGAVVLGPMQEKENMKKLRDLLSKEKKDRDIVIYCGCCPFEKCPNVRPAFKLLNEMKFTNQKLLNLPHNLKIDWINNGYPMNAQ